MSDHQAEKLLSLFELSHVLSQLDNYNAILRTIIRKSIDFFEAEDAHLELVNPATQQTIKTVMHSRSFDDPVQRKMRTLVSGWIFKNNQSCFIPQAEKHELFKKPALRKK